MTHKMNHIGIILTVHHFIYSSLNDDESKNVYSKKEQSFSVHKKIQSFGFQVMLVLLDNYQNLQ